MVVAPVYPWAWYFRAHLEEPGNSLFEISGSVMLQALSWIGSSSPQAPGDCKVQSLALYPSL